MHIDKNFIEQLTSELRDSKSKADSLNDLAWRVQSSQPQIALSYSLGALDYAEQSNYTQGIGRASHNAAIAYFMLSRYTEALRYISSALTKFQEINDIPGEALALVCQGNIQFRTGNYDLALESHYFALNLFESIDDRFHQGMCCSNIGNAYQMVGQYDEALTFLLRAMSIQEELNEKQGMAITSNNIAGIYFRLRHHQTALQYLEQSLEIFREYNNVFGLAKTLRNIGQNHECLLDFDTALKYQEESISITKKIGDKHSLAIALSNIGSIYRRCGEYEKSLDYHRRSLELYEMLNEPHGKAEEYQQIGETLRMSEQYDLSLDSYRKGMTIAEEINAKTVLADILLGASSACEMLGDFQDSLRYYVASSKIRDQILNADKQKLIAVMETRLAIENALKEREVYRLKNVELAKALNELELKEQSLAFAYQEIERKQEETVRANSELAIALERLTDLNNEKNELLGIVAHDLKNYVASIMLLAETQIIYFSSFSKEEIGGLAEKIKRSAQQMMSFIAALLDSSQIETGRMQFRLEAINIFPILQRILEQHEPYASSKNIALHLEPTAFTSAVVADSERLAQVLDNLLSNAVKYSPQNTSVYITTNFSKTMASISVRDEGPGLSEDDKKRLFKKYTRLSAKPTGNEHSTGLGLSITKKLVEGMNGNIYCVSTLGSGAEFIVELPLSYDVNFWDGEKRLPMPRN